MRRRTPKLDRRPKKSQRHRGGRDRCTLCRDWDPKPAHVRADLNLHEALAETGQ